VRRSMRCEGRRAEREIGKRPCGALIARVAHVAHSTLALGAHWRAAMGYKSAMVAIVRLSRLTIGNDVRRSFWAWATNMRRSSPA
jgi:hypothetical protein